MKSYRPQELFDPTAAYTLTWWSCRHASGG